MTRFERVNLRRTDAPTRPNSVLASIRAKDDDGGQYSSSINGHTALLSVVADTKPTRTLAYMQRIFHCVGEEYVARPLYPWDDDPGDAYPESVPDKSGIETMLMNRVVMGRGHDASRFRHVPIVDALILPLANTNVEARLSMTGHNSRFSPRIRWIQKSIFNHSLKI